MRNKIEATSKSGDKIVFCNSFLQFYSSFRTDLRTRKRADEIRNPGVKYYEFDGRVDSVRTGNTGDIRAKLPVRI